METNNNYLNHAKHNENVCEYLNKNGEYSDWVITTAFYSSIYYCDFKIFPFNLQNTETNEEDTYNTIDEYYRIYRRTNNKSKHYCRSKLIYLYINKISRDFNKLKDLSETARYVDYKIDKEFAEQAFEILENIKKECI